MPEHLPGGNSNTVVRVGDRVQRKSGLWTPTVHRLLRHLHDQGVTWVPQPVGVNATGDEWLTYLPGFVPHYPMPTWVWDDTLLDEAGRRLRGLHDATVDFETDDALADLYSLTTAIVVIAIITAASGLDVTIRMSETRPPVTRS